MAKLIFTGEKFAGRIYALALETTTVGRGDHNTLAIHDASVSQTHCELLVNGTEVIVRDLGSSNGTFANGTRLRNQQCQLLSGQIVKFGSVEARLEIDEPAASDNTATDVTAVHLHAKLLREQQQPAAQPPAPGMTLDTGSAAVTGNHTLMLPRSAAVEPKPVPSSAPPPVEFPRPSKRKPFVLLVAALVLGLALLLWLLLGRS